MNTKKNILLVITIMMVCAFSLVSCNIMGVEIPFRSDKDATEETTATEALTDNLGSDDQATSDDTSTTKPVTTTPPSTTTTPPQTTPAIENSGELTTPGYGPIGTPEA